MLCYQIERSNHWRHGFLFRSAVPLPQPKSDEKELLSLVYSLVLPLQSIETGVIRLFPEVIILPTLNGI